MEIAGYKFTSEFFEGGRSVYREFVVGLPNRGAAVSRSQEFLLAARSVTVQEMTPDDLKRAGVAHGDARFL
jgi:hypothetical protein